MQGSPTGFGILASDASPLRLRPLDLLGHETAVAMPLANPVLTHAQLPGVAALGRPTIAPSPHDAREAHMFFAARACGPAGRWGIAAAVSVDGGWTWRPLGWALREPAADLLGATAFQHNGTVRCGSRGGVGGRGTRAAHAVFWRTTEGLQRGHAPASKLCMHPLSLPLPALPSLTVLCVCPCRRSPRRRSGF